MIYMNKLKSLILNKRSAFIAIIILVYIRFTINDPILVDEACETYNKDIKNINFRNVNNKQTKMKYILQWTLGKASPFNHMGEGQEGFIQLNCPYSNCYVTDNKTYLASLKDFDAIVFNANYVTRMDQKELPQERSPTQKYVFGGTEPLPFTRACKPVLDNFFNWTWTYRIDSDFRWGYITVYDLNGTVVGPKLKMEWPEQMDPIDEDTKKILDKKKRSVAWFVSRCRSPSGREYVARDIAKELRKLHLSLDVYGCGKKHKCPRYRDDNTCFQLIKTHYYFYLAFENSFTVDYVTEKIVTALNNFAVPIVLGGADYSRFVPPGSYIDAKKLKPKQIADTIHDLMKNKTRYYDFFRWRNHFKFAVTTKMKDVCNICTALNNEQEVKKRCSHKHFREWWNEKFNYKCNKTRH